MKNSNDSLSSSHGTTILRAKLLAASLSTLLNTHFFQGKNKKIKILDTFMELQHRISMLHDYLENKCPALPAPHPAYTLIFACSNGSAPAAIFHSCAASFEHAWNSGAEKLRAHLHKQAHFGKWIRVDFVTSAEDISFADFEASLARAPACCYRHGFSLDSQFTHLLTEHECNANAIYSTGGSHVTARFQIESFLAYAKKRFADHEPLLFAPEKPIWRIATAGVFCGQDGNLRSLPGPDKKDTGNMGSGCRSISRSLQSTADQCMLVASLWLADLVQEDGTCLSGRYPCLGQPIYARFPSLVPQTAYTLIAALDHFTHPQLLEAVSRILQNFDRQNPKALINEYAEAHQSSKANDIVYFEKNAFTLLALCKWTQMSGSDVFLPLLKSMVFNLRSAIHPQTKRLISTASPDKPESALRVSACEAKTLLGLIRYYELTHEKSTLDAAQEILDALLEAPKPLLIDTYWLSKCIHAFVEHKPDAKYFNAALSLVADRLAEIQHWPYTAPSLTKLLLTTHSLLDKLRSKPELNPLLQKINQEELLTALMHRIKVLFSGFFWPETAMFFANPARLVGTFFTRQLAFRCRLDDVARYVAALLASLKFLQEQEKINFFLKKHIPRKKTFIAMLNSLNHNMTSYALHIAAQAAGAEFCLLTPSGIDVKNRKIRCRQYKDGVLEWRTKEYPDVVYAWQPQNYSAALAHLRANVPFTFHAIGSKEHSYAIFEQDTVLKKYLIPYNVVTNTHEVFNFMKMYPHIVLKPSLGTHGSRLLSLKKENRVAYSLLQDAQIQKVNRKALTQKLNDYLNGKFIAQRYIASKTASGVPFDIRLHLCRGKHAQWNLVMMYARMGFNKLLTSNISTGGGLTDAKNFLAANFTNGPALHDELLSLADYFPAAFQSGFKHKIAQLGVDVGLDADGKIFIFEVNSVLGSKYLYLEHAIQVIDYALYLAQQADRNN